VKASSTTPRSAPQFERKKSDVLRLSEAGKFAIDDSLRCSVLRATPWCSDPRAID